ncbi:N-acetylneuraminate synthase family protein [Cyanobium sp. ATX 6F1]|uniref:N-acetylneuraminate synthase family protein n=1 Tax=unclassified Cyanobium TaxID=2627006 RepID=UPI0020CBA2B2|nr:N-acetylneuraminate synthase family protein [Cyanobium sp. ATX 6F1]MCP9915156.1 N-acetylneuraminate synthase family protein [Cyanobium sp. ATX 6F1]
MALTKIRGRTIGEKNPAYIIAEIGINHNGDIQLCRELIDSAIDAGCDAVKFQKRTIEKVYGEEELLRARESPFGTTNGDLKRALEFGMKEYKWIDDYCRSKQIDWFASCWDEESVDFISTFNPPCWKIASASLTDHNLLLHTRKAGGPILLSTGMSSHDEIHDAVQVLGKQNLVLLHSCSTYPAYYEELNLRIIPVLMQQYDVPVGYSGHETGIASSVAATALGASVIERHITIDRSLWGTDQAASLEPSGFKRLVRDIRLVETSMGDGVKRVLPREVPVMEKLRRVGGWRDR